MSTTPRSRARKSSLTAQRKAASADGYGGTTQRKLATRLGAWFAGATARGAGALA